jgi:hypothetical protein
VDVEKDAATAELFWRTIDDSVAFSAKVESAAGKIRSAITLVSGRCSVDSSLFTPAPGACDRTKHASLDFARRSLARSGQKCASG